VGGLVVPEGEQAYGDACGDAGAGACAVAFEGGLCFEGPVGRFDDLAQRPQELGAGPWGFCAGGGPQHGDADVVEVGLEGLGAVALVGDEGLAWPAQAGSVDHGGADVAFVGFGAGLD